jgi:hypothetical protein
MTDATPASVIQSYDTLTELWEAVRERFWTSSNEYHPWPPLPVQWFSGTITDLVDNEDGTWTLTDDNLDDIGSGDTDDGRFWNAVERTGCGTHPQYWTGLSCGNQPYLDGNYDVIIEYDSGDGGSSSSGDEWYRTLKPWFPMRGNIIGNTNKTLTFTANLQNWVTAGAIPGESGGLPATLYGKRYYIIRTGLPWWADVNSTQGRWPDWPNANELWVGTVETGKLYDDGSGYIREPRNSVNPSPYYLDEPPLNSWGRDIWAASSSPYDVMVFGDDHGGLHRLQPTSNTSNTIFFGGLDHIPTELEEESLTITATLSGDYSIVARDAMCWPGRRDWPCFRWNTGYHVSYYGHGPTYDGSSPATNTLPTYPAIIFGDNYSYNAVGDILDAGLCSIDEPAPTGSLVTLDSLDNDIHTPSDNICTPADHFAAIEIHKTIRQLQKVIEDAVGSFIRPVSYSGEKEIPSYAIARAFHDCGINAGTATVAKTTTAISSGTLTTYYFQTTGDQYKNKFIYYEVVQGGIRQNANNYDGSNADEDGKVIVFTTEDGDTTLHDANWLGASVWWSAGWTRYYPLLVTHFYPRWIWIPDIDQDEFENKFPVYPPEVTDFEGFGCFGVGQWIKREPSTGYKVYTQRGEALDNSRDFVAGDVVRFDGDNFHEPGTGQTVKDGEDAEDLPWWDRQFTGKHKRQIHPRILDDLLFTVTDSTKYSVTDSSKDWWRDWYEGGTLATHNFTAQAGSSTTFETEDTWGDDGNADSCWFQLSRFATWDAAFKDFILEIDKVEHNPDTDADETITYKLPITDVTLDGTMQVIHFAAVDRKYGGGSLEITAGLNGRIREPNSKLNRYRGHRVEITDPSGNLVEVDCLLSDDQTLFFAARSEAFPVGSTGKIIEYYPGGCWEFRTTAPTDEEKAAGIKWQKIDTDKYFVQVHGDDPRGEPWHVEGTENEPGQSPIDFGRFTKGDYVWFGILNQMYLMINKLRWIKKGSDWTALDMPNGMFWQVSGIAGASYGPAANGYTPPNDNYDTAWAAWAADVASGWPYFPLTGPSSGPPVAQIINETTMTATTLPVRDVGYISNNNQISRQFAFPIVTGCPILISSSVLFMAYAQIDSPNHDEGVVKDWVVEGGSGDAQTNYEENHFDPQGTSLLFRAWAEVGTLDPDNAATRTGDTQVGDAEADAPNWTQAPDPVAHQDDANSVSGNDPSGATSIINSGFIVTNQIAILKFDVAGGLDFVA